MKRQIYEHNINLGSMEVEFYDTGTYDIDQPIDTVQVNATNFQGPRLAYEQWKALPEDAKKIWDMLSPEAKAIILQPPPKPDPNRPTNPFGKSLPKQQNPPVPRKSVHEHYNDYIILCLHELHGGDTPPTADSSNIGGDTSVHEDTPATEEQPLLAHMMKKKPLPPGNVKRLL